MNDSLYIRVPDIAHALKIGTTSAATIARVCFDPKELRFLQRDGSGARLHFFSYSYADGRLKEVATGYDANAALRLTKCAHANAVTFAGGQFVEY